MGINPFHLGHSPANRKRLVNVELRLNGMVSGHGSSQNQPKDPQSTAHESMAVTKTHHIASLTILTRDPLCSLQRIGLSLILTPCPDSTQRILAPKSFVDRDRVGKRLDVAAQSNDCKPQE